jgi:IclR family acetate operon transcriptional repressor
MHDPASTAVDRSLSILEALAESRDGLSNSEISRRFRIPKSSTSYLLRTLERRGYVRRDRGGGKYHLGLKVLALNRGLLAALEIRGPALPILHWLVERVRLTTHLAVLDHGHAVYVEKVEAPGFIKMDTWVGRRMAVHTTSVGKALVSRLSREDVEAILHEHGLARATPKTITSAARFLQELEKTRARGYALDDEENNPGVRCVAAPVVDSSGQVQAAVGVSGTTAQVTHANIPRIAELVQEAARRVSRQLA